MPSDETITVVSGLPRSGTSMMMQMLGAGGLAVLTDGKRGADADNPRGYYEYEAVKSLGQDASWLASAGGKAVKIVSALLIHLPDGFDYRVIFMRRPIAEVLASQRAMLDRLGHAGPRGDESGNHCGQAPPGRARLAGVLAVLAQSQEAVMAANRWKQPQGSEYRKGRHCDFPGSGSVRRRNSQDGQRNGFVCSYQ